jgi:hypothetical protein
MHAGQMMIHEAWGGCVGPADDMRQMAEILDQQSSVIADIYATRAGGDHTAEEFRALMVEETWLTDQAAVDLGLADEVMTPSKKDDPSDSITRADLDRLRDEIVAQIPAPVAGPSDSDPEPDPTDDADPAESFLRALLAPTEGVQA